MPILETETNIFPENLLDEAAGNDENRQWWVLMTKSRQEKAVARDLLSRRLPFYLPLIWKDNFFRGRRLRSHIPLFANYVFLFGTDAERVSSLQSNRLCQTLHVAEQAELMNDLRSVQRLILSDAPLTVESRLEAGRRVRVKAGAMRGVEGQVTQRRSRSRLLVLVHFLQTGVSVEMDDFMLEPIEPASSIGSAPSRGDRRRKSVSPG
jgi:hypothetical protein